MDMLVLFLLFAIFSGTAGFPVAPSNVPEWTTEGHDGHNVEGLTTTSFDGLKQTSTEDITTVENLGTPITKAIGKIPVGPPKQANTRIRRQPKYKLSTFHARLIEGFFMPVLGTIVAIIALICKCLCDCCKRLCCKKRLWDEEAGYTSDSDEDTMEKPQPRQPLFKKYCPLQEEKRHSRPYKFKTSRLPENNLHHTIRRRFIKKYQKQDFCRIGQRNQEKRLLRIGKRALRSSWDIYNAYLVCARCFSTTYKLQYPNQTAQDIYSDGHFLQNIPIKLHKLRNVTKSRQGEVRRRVWWFVHQQMKEIEIRRSETHEYSKYLRKVRRLSKSPTHYLGLLDRNYSIRSRKPRRMSKEQQRNLVQNIWGQMRV
uniref:Uncharacterized protein n=1 Tax=Pyxicephalus adspersus TaxID=30357 RepID=A0AAV2ZWI2_PYXAD|nr:TPA: hypothetical protein GDO54_005396 [Pyxicephalus adspersus]